MRTECWVLIPLEEMGGRGEAICDLYPSGCKSTMVERRAMLLPRDQIVSSFPHFQLATPS